MKLEIMKCFCLAIIVIICGERQKNRDGKTPSGKTDDPANYAK